MSSHFSPVKNYFHTEILFSLTKVLTIVSNQFNIRFSSPALSVNSVDMPFF